MENSKIKPGKSYILRNGLKTSPIRLANNGTRYIYESEVKEKEYENSSILNWLESGRFLTNDTEHKYDIIF